MKVDGVNLERMQVLQAKKLELVESASEQDTQDQKTEKVNEPSSAEPEPVNQEADDAEHSKGVLRLLQEGHFKGVADVRLRINFFEELATIESAQRQAVTEEKVGGTLESVGGAVDSFLVDNELTEEQATSVLQAKDSFIQAVNGADDPTSTIGESFAAFLESLAGLAPAPLETEVQETTPAEQGAEETETAGQTEEQGGENEPSPLTESGPDWQGFIANLQALFTKAMDELNSALGAVSALPPLSEPSGNGVAYEKFLATYNQMRGVETADTSLDATEPPEPVE